MNKYIITAFVLHLMYTLMMYLSDDVNHIIGMVLSAFTITNFIGIILILNCKTFLGAKVFLYSSIIFIPLGIIGIIGARKVIDKDIEEKFLNKN